MITCWTRTVLTVVVSLVCTGQGVSAQTIHPADTASLTLFQTVARGLAVHPRTKAALAAENSAAAGARAAGASLLPSLSAQGTATRFQEAMIVAPLHRFDPMAPPSFATTLVQSRWTASYTLFDGGARRAAIQEANATTLAAGAASRATRMSVIEEVANAFLSVLAARELNDAERRRLLSLDRERARVQQLYDVGRTPRVALLRAEAALANAQASQIVVAQRLDASLYELSRLLVAPVDSLRRLSFAAVSARDDVPLDTERFVARALSANPHIMSARHDVEVRRASERGARASWLPTVQLAAGLITYAGSGADLTGEWQGSVAVSYPIFTGGARTHQISSAVAAREAAESSVRARELEIAVGVDRLIAKVTESRARVSALRAAVMHAEEVARIEQLSLSAGSGVQTDFLRAEADLFAARANLVQATHGEVIALIALARATGELTLEWLHERVESE